MLLNENLGGVAAAAAGPGEPEAGFRLASPAKGELLGLGAPNDIDEPGGGAKKFEGVDVAPEEPRLPPPGGSATAMLDRALGLLLW